MSWPPGLNSHCMHPLVLKLLTVLFCSCLSRFPGFKTLHILVPICCHNWTFCHYPRCSLGCRQADLDWRHVATCLHGESGRNPCAFSVGIKMAQLLWKKTLEISQRVKYMCTAIWFRTAKRDNPNLHWEMAKQNAAYAHNGIVFDRRRKCNLTRPTRVDLRHRKSYCVMSLLQGTETVKIRSRE